MKKVAVITATRAEYGLLSPIVKKLREYEDGEFVVELLVTGTHLSKEYGYTVKEIESDNLRIDDRIIIPTKTTDLLSISQNQAETLMLFTKKFLEKQYAAILILGDRYEMLAIAIAAGNTKIPIFHISGGDTTEGAMDEWIRHSVTKMSYLHFTTNSDSYKRVIQLGENPSRVFNYGSTSIDNILNIAKEEKIEILSSLGIEDCKYAICTYHPVTLGKGGIEKDIKEFLEAIKVFPNIEFIVTKSNADMGGALINKILDNAQKSMENLHVFSSLGVKRYLSLMRNAEFVLGNSSSGIVEAPVFGIPTINIGDRQRGRLQSESIINCAPNKESICKAINKAMTEDFRELCSKVDSPYGDGNAANQIAVKVYEIVMYDDIDLKKKFYDVEVRL